VRGSLIPTVLVFWRKEGKGWADEIGGVKRLMMKL
jgi:hypothetical protein